MSIAHRLADPTDAEIRNKVEGYHAEAEVIAEAARSFGDWWESLGHVARCEMDGDTSWRSYCAGWLSMARELGQLPPAGTV